MRFYNQQHGFYAGIDLHARTLYLCVLDSAGQTRVHENLPCRVDRLQQALEPFGTDLVVACETTFSWYWLADFCEAYGYPFVLGHALYMKAIHGGKVKNDRIDAAKIAGLLRGGVLPQAYVYPSGMRQSRDLLRRRTLLVRRRAEAMGHVKLTNAQYLFPVTLGKLSSAASRKNISEAFQDPSVRLNVETDITLMNHLDGQIKGLEAHLVRTAKIDNPQMFHLLRTFPGIGQVLALTIMYEVHTIDRFPSVGQFISYCRLVKCEHSSAGKRCGSGGKKIGNAYLRWAFGEAALLLIRESDQAKRFVDRMTQKHGKGKAISILSAKIARCVYHMLRRGRAFDNQRFWGEPAREKQPVTEHPT